jgi:hypothetical protein
MPEGCEVNADEVEFVKEVSYDMLFFSNYLPDLSIVITALRLLLMHWINAIVEGVLNQLNVLQNSVFLATLGVCGGSRGGFILWVEGSNHLEVDLRNV